MTTWRIPDGDGGMRSTTNYEEVGAFIRGRQGSSERGNEGDGGKTHTIRPTRKKKRSAG